MKPHPSGTYRPAASAPAPEAAVLDLSVIIVNYNVREFLEQALRSLERACGSLAMEIFVVDNNSVDGSVEMIRKAFPHVRLIANCENLGFGRANNQAIRQARGRYLLILNPDTIVQEDTLHTLVQFMETHPEAGAVGCKILNPDGTFAPESRRAFPTPSVAFYRITGLSRLFPHDPTFGRYNLTYLPEDEVAEVDALSGSCMLVRHDALYKARDDGRGLRGEENGHAHPPDTVSHASGAGLFDEDFFMYGEDLDWCYRIQQAGWKVYYTPDTQIIHYKGESTKKGELRYVRLFYGAMLLFAEKHVQGRYSHVMARVLRLGIMLRAGLGVLSRGLRRWSGLLLDAVLVVVAVALVGLGHSLLREAQLTPLFFASVPAVYAAATVASIAMVSGYRWRHRHRLRPVAVGAFIGLLVVATASFFIKEIAFSRIVVLASFPVVMGLLALRRLWARSRQPVQGLCRAVLVGPQSEAERLQHLLAAKPLPPFELVGYVDDGLRTNGTATLPHLGTLRQLRDVVRLRRIDDVVFAADGLPNHTIISLIHHLRDLPVQFKILAEGREHLIGKASIDDLSMPSLIEAEAAVGTPRSRAARRTFEVGIALIGLLMHPLLALAARLAGPNSGTTRVLACTRRLPAVLDGRLALVGYDPDRDPPPPDEAVLRPAIFSIAGTLPASSTEADVQRAYTFYISNASASLDWAIAVRSLRRLWNASLA